MKINAKELSISLWIFTILLLASSLAFADSWHYCEVPGTEKPLKYRGTSLDQAMMRASQACVDQQKKAYESQRGPLPIERAEIFVESCVNLVQCTRG